MIAEWIEGNWQKVTVDMKGDFLAIGLCDECGTTKVNNLLGPQRSRKTAADMVKTRLLERKRIPKGSLDKIKWVSAGKDWPIVKKSDQYPICKEQKNRVVTFVPVPGGMHSYLGSSK
jgi:outer membrane protein OmpA-like peptidoglycan-associated protein